MRKGSSIILCRCRVWTAILFVGTLAGGAVGFSGTIHAPARSFDGTGVVEEIRIPESMVVVKHQAISNYMKAMTMPFKVEKPAELAHLKPGDKISFKLLVSDDDSQLANIRRIGTTSLGQGSQHQTRAPAPSQNPLLDCPFTNQLGQAVRLSDFRGQALAITFIYTRCPVPNFCPRLSKNFVEAIEQLKAMTNAPDNWHFISVTFDPIRDTPEVLKSYAERYHYDPARWTFLTGDPSKIGELARACGVESDAEAGATINHNFRTLIIDAAGHLQMVFPMAGDFSSQIVSEMVKATRAGPTAETEPAKGARAGREN